MFTEQYIHFRKQLFVSVADSSYQSYTAFDGSTFTVQSGSIWSHDFGACMYAQCRALAAGWAGVWFGTGATPAKKADISLESVITSGLEIASGAVPLFSEPSAGVYEVSGTYAVKNTTDADITISEVGYFGSFGASYKPVLYERTVLDMPITIEPGLTKTITYKLTFKH